MLSKLAGPISDRLRLKSVYSLRERKDHRGQLVAGNSEPEGATVERVVIDGFDVY